MFRRPTFSDPTANLGIKAFEEAEAGHLFFFNNEDSRETHVGAIGYIDPVVGTDSSFLNSLQAVLSGSFPPALWCNGRSSEIRMLAMS